MAESGKVPTIYGKIRSCKQTTGSTIGGELAGSVPASDVPYSCRGSQVACSIIPRTQESGAVLSNVVTVGLCMLLAGQAAQPEEKF